MGLEVHPSAPIPRQGLMRRAIGRDALFASIEKAIREYVTDPILSLALTFETREHTLHVGTHPAASPIEFTWRPDGTIDAWTKTSTVGPGYHVFVIDLLKHVSSRCGLRWNWADADDAEYAIRQNLEDVQEHMVHVLRGIAALFLEKHSKSCEHLMANMPMNYPAAHASFFSLSPLGPFSREWWQGLCGHPGDDLIRRKCIEFFPWWQPGFDAAFYRNLGLMLMWCEVPWHPPTNANEETVCQLAIQSLAQARRIDPQVEIPERELTELTKMMKTTDQDELPVPEPSGVGYRRYPRFYHATGGWSLVAPGYFYETFEDDGTKLVLWHRKRTIYVTTFSVGTKDGSIRDPHDMMGPAREVPEDHEPIAFEGKGVLGRGTISRTSEDDHEYWILSGKVTAPSTFSVVTICFDDDADHDWAVQVFSSFTYSPSNRSESDPLAEALTEDGVHK